MKKVTFLIVFLLFAGFGIYAEEYEEHKTTETTVQVRLDFTYTHRFKHGMALSLFEDLRLDLAPFATRTLFDMSLTSITFEYSPIQYLKVDAGYMLKIYGAHSEAAWEIHWNDPSSYVRHRVYTGITGNYSYEGWQFSLRERLLLDMRFDDYDLRTTAKYALTMRHHLKMQYNFKSKGVSPYIWTEIANTLNANEYCQKNGHQYVERIRNCAGVKWKIPTSDKNKGTLNFFYRYDWGYFRSAKFSETDEMSVNIRRKNEHAIGIGYEL